MAQGDADAPRRYRDARGRPSAHHRGYGRAHRRLRESVRPHVEAGGVTCWRCGQLIAKGEEWDLGHDDVDRSIYRGPEHMRECNRATKGRRYRDPPAQGVEWW